MILYEPVSSIKDYGLRGKLFFKYIRIIQDKDFLKVLQTKTDEYIKEVQCRYKRRYSIKNIILKKIKEVFEMNKEQDIFTSWGLTLIIRRLLKIMIENNKQKGTLNE